MNYPILHCPWLKVNGMALFPFILISNKAKIKDAILINHELIHIRQQLEMLVIPFYIFYLLNYMVNIIKFKNHDKAYLEITFEKEAYQNDHNLAYLKSRPFWAFLKY